VVEPVPFRIDPTFSARVWGAHSLAPIYPQKQNLKEPVGEAWLTATDCCVANGPFQGHSFGTAWHAMPAEWRGTRLASFRDFPVLVKFIFPQEKLSIQVHPDDAFASQHEQAAGGRGKTEMWHIVWAQPEAELLIGLKHGVTKSQFVEAVHNGSVEDLLVHHSVRPGDTFFVPAGTQHAIGPGVIVCEIQEYSDLTYRVYDYDRVDSSGKPRELHLDKALQVTRFSERQGGKIPPLALHSPDANKHLLVACDFFSTERWDCHKTTPIESEPAQFQLLVILQGSGQLIDSDFAAQYAVGECWFLPASLPTILLQPDGSTSLLRITIPDRTELRRQLRSLGFEEHALSRVLIG
jgi:mannose-6-phosphate isomerase